MLYPCNFFPPSTCSNLISHLSPCKAPGLDSINLSILKLSSPVISGPLSSIINFSIATSLYRDQWKMSLVCPLHKGGSPSNSSNYRPISLLSTVRKLCERFVNKKLKQHLHSHLLLYPLQSVFAVAFFYSHSCCTWLTLGTSPWTVETCLEWFS